MIHRFHIYFNLLIPQQRIQPERADLRFSEQGVHLHPATLLKRQGPDWQFEAARMLIDRIATKGRIPYGIRPESICRGSGRSR